MASFLCLPTSMVTIRRRWPAPMRIESPTNDVIEVHAIPEIAEMFAVSRGWINKWMYPKLGEGARTLKNNVGRPMGYAYGSHPGCQSRAG